MDKLPGDYIAGFVDGEGCFSLKYRIDRKINKSNLKVRQYFYWGLEFAIVLRADDIGILKKIQEVMQCGKINLQKEHQARFSVQGIHEITNYVIPFFKKFPLRAKKANDFILWEQAANIVSKYRNGKINIESGTRGFIRKNISAEDSEYLKKLRNNMLNFKSLRDKNYKWGEIIHR